jgi:arsenite-transporting ATPase
MAIRETERLLTVLGQSGIIPRQMIVNNVMTSSGCDFCKRRRISQQPHLVEISRTFGNLNMVEVPMFAEEIRGIESLTELKKCLFKEKCYQGSGSGQNHDISIN